MGNFCHFTSNRKFSDNFNLFTTSDVELQNGHQIVERADEISSAMRAVPINLRGQITATRRVTAALIDSSLGLIHDPSEQQIDDEPGEFCADDRQFLNELRYSLASGELLQNHTNLSGAE